MNPIYAWWPREPSPGNFGDILTPYLINKLTKRYPIYVNKEFSKHPVNLMVVGSIINYANKNAVVWGSGAMKITDKPSNLADYRAVRGPITRNLILQNGGQCPEIYGDPGLLLPHFYTPKSVRKYRIGIIPHYVDFDLIKHQYKDHPEIKIINLLNCNIENVIDDINECENIISSSLHGIITAHAYGIPAAWAKFSNKLHGDGTKFKDYFASVGVELNNYIIEQKLSFDELINLNYVNGILFDKQKLLDAFPYDKLN